MCWHTTHTHMHVMHAIFFFHGDGHSKDDTISTDTVLQSSSYSHYGIAAATGKGMCLLHLRDFFVVLSFTR